VKNKVTFIYTSVGIVFSFGFYTLIAIAVMRNNQITPSFSNFLLLHEEHPPLLLFDVLPIIISLIAYIAGKQHNRAIVLNDELKRIIQDRESLITELSVARDRLRNKVEVQIEQIRTAAEVARETTKVRNLNDLLNITVQIIPQRFNFYHTGIFLVDEIHEFAVLKAANSMGGQKMLARGHKLKIGEVGIVGYVAKTGDPRIALDVGEDAVFFNNPDLPQTKSEMALPIMASGKILGVLDIQSTKRAAFGDEDILTLQIIADSLATAIENANLLTELENNLNEIQLLHQQYLRKSWAKTIDDFGTLHYSYQAGGEITSDMISSTNNKNENKTIDFPIKLRDLSIGNLTLEFDDEEAISKFSEISKSIDKLNSNEEVSFINTVLSQTAQALENARLLEETQQKAYIEEVSSNISNKIWTETEINQILKTALQEISESLNVSEGYIQLEINK